MFISTSLHINKFYTAHPRKSCFDLCKELHEEKMTEYIKKQVEKTTVQDLRDHAELTMLVGIFVFSIMGVTP